MAATDPRRAAQADGDPELRLGHRLRAARLRRGQTINDVAAATGLTKGFISQLERDLATPSVASLVRICSAVDIPVGALFEPRSTDLVRHADRPRINFGGSDVREWLLTPNGSPHVCVIESEIAPGGGSGPEAYTLDADAEWTHVLSGRLTIVVGDRTYELGAGDSLTFSPRTPHTWRNAHDEPTHVLWTLAGLHERFMQPPPAS